MDETRLNALIADLADDFRPMVADIENDTPHATRNAYGRYLRVLLRFPQEQRKLMALALLEAGANAQGMRDALKNAV